MPPSTSFAPMTDCRPRCPSTCMSLPIPFSAFHSRVWHHSVLSISSQARGFKQMPSSSRCRFRYWRLPPCRRRWVDFLRSEFFSPSHSQVKYDVVLPSLVSLYPFISSLLVSFTTSSLSMTFSPRLSAEMQARRHRQTLSQNSHFHSSHYYC